MKKSSVIAFLIWTLIVAGSYIGLLRLTDNVTSHSGAEVTFSMTEGFELTTAIPSRIELASPSFFVLRNLKTSEVITGVPTPRPLGWDYEEYYTADQELKPGTWEMQTGGDVTIRITAPDDIRARTSRTEYSRSLGAFWLLIVSVVIWLIGLVIGASASSNT